MQLATQIAEQTKRVNLQPTEGQKRAGNYQKGHIKVHGLDITIENPKGSMRSGSMPDGKKWTSQLPHHYGYFRRSEGGDGDHVDVYVGPHLKSPKVFVIDQHELGSKLWDEHKVLIGFGSKQQALAAYIKAFSDGKGRDRIGHIETMTIDGFKRWLRDGETTKPIKRAAGGRVGYAEGGAPAFDQTEEIPPFDQTEPTEPDAGKLDAAMRGITQGASMNYFDELKGARAAAPKIPGTDWNIPEFVGPIPARTLAGAARTGLGYMTGADPEGVKQYEQARDAERRAVTSAKKQHPWVYAGSEMAGAIPAMAALPEVGAAKALAPAASGIKKFGARMLDAAGLGGLYGAGSGAGSGENAAERAVNAATGLVSGIVGGAVGQAGGEAVGAVANRFGAPVVQTVRGWFNHEGEAARRVATALRADNELIMAGKAQGMTPQQWAAARQNGEPVTLADLGSAHTQSLLRSAANTSPQARAQLEKVIQERFLSQTERVGDTVRKAIPGSSGNARKTSDQIVAEYDAGRVPLYRQSYADGDKPIISPALDRMMGSDTFVGAMKRAISSGKDRDVTEGLGGFNPMVSVTADGRVVFNKGAQGAPTYPNLQYWDQVKRELDDVATKAARSGAKGEADVAGKMATILRDELDKQVSSYAKARGFAADYFGEKNALDAGRALAGKKPPAEEVKAIMRKMQPDERALFQEGYASDLVEKVINRMKDTQDVTKAMFNSPNERQLAAAIFGPGGMAMLRARMTLETIMDGARQAMGNSTTARQLIEAGLAGGAISGVATGWDPGSMMAGATGLAGARYGKHAHAGLSHMADSVKHMIGKVDAKTAARVAELLTSSDPRLLMQGYQMAAKSEAIMQGLRRVANRVALAGQTGTRQPVTEGVRALTGPVGARAEEEQKSP
ncbi:MAG: hypothetical protein KBE22_08860 [Candidatus Accumulibacter sp.]|nr:hypothetical protein [Accumulibacter sp.]